MCQLKRYKIPPLGGAGAPSARGRLALFVSLQPVASVGGFRPLTFEVEGRMRGPLSE
jgi:hypothetical protein